MLVLPLIARLPARVELLLLSLLLVLPGCDQELTPIPIREPFPSEVPGGIALGLSAEALQRERPDMGLEPSIGYQDYLSSVSWVVYEFQGTGEQSPPPASSPLVGIQWVRKGRDSAVAFREWRRLMGVVRDSLRAPPTCFELEERRAHHIRAEWGDSVRLTLGVLVRNHPDGVAYTVESTNRFGVGRGAGAEDGPAPVGTRVRCDSLPGQPAR